MKNKVFLTILTIIVSINIFAQTGILKIFSEIDSVKIYLDEVYKGMDVKVIEGLKESNYYLKVLKGETAIFSEVIGIKENQTTTILLKMTDEIKKKLLQGMTPQIDEYKSKMMTVYEGSYTKWHVRIGGTQISDVEYLKLTNDTMSIKRMERDKIAQTIRTIIAVPLIVAGGAFYIYSIVMIASENPVLPGAKTDFWTNAMYIAIGVLPLGVGVGLTAGQGTVRYATYEGAVEFAKKYNAKLKEDLKLPADFEPTP